VSENSQKKPEYNNWYNTWYRLCNSKRILKGKRKDWENSCPNEPGFYLISCPNIPFPEKYLKIGIGQGEGSKNKRNPRKGLRQRLYENHFGGGFEGSVLNRRLGQEDEKLDRDLQSYVLKNFKKNLIHKEDRKWFLENECIVQFISSKKLKEKYGTLETPIEHKIEDYLVERKNVRIIDMKKHTPLPFK
tara:strand:+ start:121 stop:687 length:567 start_codon:yes stop_codon:yes gene_type:complete